MFKFFNKKGLIKLYSKILNSKITYLVLILIILIQFILVSIIFLQNKKSKYIIEQTNFKAATIENQLNQTNKTIQAMQSQIMRMSAQVYRLQAIDE